MKGSKKSDIQGDKNELHNIFDLLDASSFTSKEYFIVLLVLSVIVFIHVVLTISVFILPGD